MSVNRVILSWPTLLSTPAAQNGSTAPRSWIQLAKTGSFVSNRYGQFSITREDLAQMLSNFRNVTPAAPTELPIDYDHLSMDPKKPGDGIAAGWIKQLELRNNGDELWALAEWTEDGAERIRKKEYQFVSPSFVKDHTHKDGRKIGTTLLASAVTNHPYLEGMQALTLVTPALAGVHLHAALRDLVAAPVTLAELGQHVSFLPDAARTPELTDEERGQTFVVKTTIGDGDNQFMRLARLDGTEFGWFRVNQLAPAPATEPERTTREENTTMQDTKTTEQKAAAFADRVTVLSKDRPLRDAVSLATMQDAEGAEAYRLAGIGAERVKEEPATISLSAHSSETFDGMCMRVANERGIPLKQAVREVSMARPDLAAARG